METKFEQHCIVEIMGHQQIAGLVSEQVIAGTAFVRVDVPATSSRAGYTKFYGGAAIYSITPVEASVAQAMAEGLNQPPIEVWRLKAIGPGHQVAPHNHDFGNMFNDEDPLDDDDDFDEGGEVGFYTQTAAGNVAHVLGDPDMDPTMAAALEQLIDAAHTAIEDGTLKLDYTPDDRPELDDIDLPF